MKKKSNKSAAFVSTPVPSLGKRSRLPALLRVPVPPEVERWQRGGAQCEPYRQITQARAVEITGKSSHTVKRWANGRQAIDTASLRLLQMWVWGIIPAREFIEAGIFVAHNQRWHPTFTGQPQSLIATDNGYLVSPSDLESFGWLRTHYAASWARQQPETAQEAPQAAPGAQIIPLAAYRTLLRPPAPDSEAGEA